MYEVAYAYLSDVTLLKHRWPLYAEKVAAKTRLSLIYVWGFIDGTLLKLARPGKKMQKAAYSGHKRCHGIKFQNVTTPDGLIAHLYGGIAGSRHDSHMLDNSNILPRLQAAMTGNQQRIYPLFGDPAYPQSPHLMGGIQRAAPNSMEAAWNRRMARARICVEWTFGEVGRQFRSLSLKPTMMIYRFPVTNYYFVAVFLMNCRN